MLYLWVQMRDSYDPGGVSVGSRLAVYQTLFIEFPSSIFFWYVLCVIVLFLFLFSCSCWSFVDVPLIFYCPADHVPDWQQRILLGAVEARSVDVNNTHTHY